MFSLPLKCFLKQARWNISILANSFTSPNFFVLIALEVKHYPFLVYFIVWKHTPLKWSAFWPILLKIVRNSSLIEENTHWIDPFPWNNLFVLRMAHFFNLKLLPKFQGPVYTFWCGLSTTDRFVLLYLYVYFPYTNRERQIWLRTPLKCAELAQSRNVAW